MNPGKVRCEMSIIVADDIRFGEEGTQERQNEMVDQLLEAKLTSIL